MSQEQINLCNIKATICNSYQNIERIITIQSNYNHNFKNHYKLFNFMNINTP